MNSFSVQGTTTFNGDGTGSFQGRSVSIFNPVPPVVSTSAGASSDDFQGSFVYTVAADDTFTRELSGPLTGTVLTGPRAGQTFTIDKIPLKGFIAHDGLTLASDEPTVETVTFVGSLPGQAPIEYRICHRSRTLFRLKNNLE